MILIDQNRELHRQEGETLLAKMGIEGECGIQPVLAHDLETGTVDERKVAAVGDQQGAHPLFVDGLIDPENLNDG